jgi:hypothetical protein
MICDEWVKRLDSQLNAATILLLTCDEREEAIILENLRRSIKELSWTLLTSLSAQQNARLN